MTQEQTVQSEPNQQEAPQARKNLDTQQLQLEAPIWSYGDNEYDAKKMAVTIVDFLAKLAAQNIDRTNSPQIASFTAERVQLDEFTNINAMFNTRLAISILHEAARRGIDVGYISRRAPDGRVFVNRAKKFEPEQPAVGLRGRLKYVFTQGGQKPLQPIPVPRFLLEITLGFDGPESPDFQRSTYSYKTFKHGVKIVQPEGLEIHYSFYPYGES